MITKRFLILVAAAQLSITNCRVSVAQQRVTLDLDRTVR